MSQPGLDFDMESGGHADFYYGGFMAAGTWSAPNRTSPLVFALDNGAAITPPTSLTWVAVVRG